MHKISWTKSSVCITFLKNPGINTKGHLAYDKCSQQKFAAEAHDLFPSTIVSSADETFKIKKGYKVYISRIQNCILNILNSKENKVGSSFHHDSFWLLQDSVTWQLGVRLWTKQKKNIIVLCIFLAYNKKLYKILFAFISLKTSLNIYLLCCILTERIRKIFFLHHLSLQYHLIKYTEQIYIKPVWWWIIRH